MATVSDSRLEQLFPELKKGGYGLTSPETANYNCIAWAAGDDQKWWEPDQFGQYYWPPIIQRSYTLDAYKEAFSTLGYVECDSDGYEPNFEKIALYIDNRGLPTHASRQLASGMWTSKLGKYKDIEHTLKGLCGNEYGELAVVMKRSTR